MESMAAADGKRDSSSLSLLYTYLDNSYFDGDGDVRMTEEKMWVSGLAMNLSDNEGMK